MLSWPAARGLRFNIALHRRSSEHHTCFTLHTKQRLAPWHRNILIIHCLFQLKFSVLKMSTSTVSWIFSKAAPPISEIKKYRWLPLESIMLLCHICLQSICYRSSRHRTETEAWRKRLSFRATHSCNSPVATSWECRGGESSWWGCRVSRVLTNSREWGRLKRRDSAGLIINHRSREFCRNEESSEGPPAHRHTYPLSSLTWQPALNHSLILLPCFSIYTKPFMV